MGGPQGRSGHGVEEKILSTRRHSNPDHPVVQPTVSPYTDWATPAVHVYFKKGKFWHIIYIVYLKQDQQNDVVEKVKFYIVEYEEKMQLPD
jgi:hypothetical protein